jgi:excisionase family DNA binding protein
MDYVLTRNEAADFLGISTRTLDRYIRRGRVSYKKSANKVLLAQQELDKLKEHLHSINQDMQFTEVV